MHIEESVTINQPVDKVFQYVADIANRPKWLGPVQQASGDANSTFNDSVTFMGRDFQLSYQVATYDPPRMLVYRATSGPFDNYENQYMFESVGGGTKVTSVTNGEPGSVFKLAGPLLSRNAKKQVGEDLKTLKQQLET